MEWHQRNLMKASKESNFFIGLFLFNAFRIKNLQTVDGFWWFFINDHVFLGKLVKIKFLQCRWSLVNEFSWCWFLFLSFCIWFFFCAIESFWIGSFFYLGFSKCITFSIVDCVWNCSLEYDWFLMFSTFGVFYDAFYSAIGD